MSVANSIISIYNDSSTNKPEQVQALFDDNGVTKKEVLEVLYDRNFEFDKFSKMLDLVNGVQENTDLVKGDVNGDGKVDITDATFIQLFAAKAIDHFE